MASDADDLWQALLDEGETLASEEDYEHGYKRELRQDLRQLIWFMVGEESYGLGIEDIEEISKPFVATPVPRTAEFVLGIGNVRGNVIPLVDLGRRLRLGRVNPNRRPARVLIVRHHNERYGLLVDGVRGVVQVAPEHMEEAPGAIGDARAEFIQGLARTDETLLIVLELDSLLAAKDFIPPRYRGDARGAR